MAPAGNLQRTKASRALRLARRKARSRRSLGLAGAETKLLISKHVRRMVPREKQGLLLSLPDEMILEVLSYFTAKELNQTRPVCHKLQMLIDNTSSLWTNASFSNFWPADASRSSFERAADCGNIECLFKLGLSHLYCYNLDASTKRSTAVSNLHGQEAAAAFTKADSIIYPRLPCTWVLIRPPWTRSTAGNCCVKECVFNSLQEMYSSAKVPSLALTYNVGVVTLLSKKEAPDSRDLLQRGVDSDCPHALFKAYSSRRGSGCDAATSICLHRLLRKAATLGNVCAQLELAHLYAAGEYGHLPEADACAFLRQWIKSSCPSGNQNIFKRQPFLLNAMRLMLIDWLVEVSAMKDLPSAILHVAVSCLDSYLLKRNVERKILQLAGIVCLLVAAKFDGNEDHIITIRESAWLTDNTYQYEDVVKMIGEILGTLRGNIPRLTSMQFASFIKTLFPVNEQRDHLVDFLLDLSLHFTDFGIFKPSVIAASAVFLANLMLGHVSAWTERAVSFTGLEISDLLDCVSVLYRECASRSPKVVDAHSAFKGVGERYKTQTFDKVALLPVIGLGEFVSRLEMTCPGLHVIVERDGIRFVFDNNARRCGAVSRSTLELRSMVQVTSFNNSGYEGDLDECSDCDQSTTNCSDMVDTSEVPMSDSQSSVSLGGDGCCGLAAGHDASGRHLTCSPSPNELGQMQRETLDTVCVSSKANQACVDSFEGRVRSPLKFIGNPSVSHPHASKSSLSPSNIIASPKKRTKL